MLNARVSSVFLAKLTAAAEGYCSLNLIFRIRNLSWKNILHPEGISVISTPNFTVNSILLSNIGEQQNGGTDPLQKLQILKKWRKMSWNALMMFPCFKSVGKLSLHCLLLNID